MKILIIGSEGFIGHHLAKFFMEQRHEVYGADLFERPTLEYRYFKVSRLSPSFTELFETSYDYCINAAGSGSVPFSVEHPLADFEANTLDTVRLLDCMRLLNKHCRFLYISSAAVYGNPSSLPVTEEHDVKPMSPYGWHKYLGEKLCREYVSLFKLSACSIRPFSVYGPGLRKQLFWDLFRKKINNTSNTIELFGTGNESRDFIYIQDLVKAVDCVLQKAPMKGEVYNVASGTERSIREAAGLMLARLNYTGDLNFNGKQKPGDPLHWRADIGKLESLGFAPEVVFEEGISNYCKWLIETESV